MNVHSPTNTRSAEFVNKYRNDASPYAAIYARADQIKRQADDLSAGPEVVTRAIERAITARRPRARYVAPFSYRLVLGLVGLLPTRWVDAILMRTVGLTKKGLRPVKSLGAALPG